jgi:hypothetical protein
MGKNEKHFSLRHSRRGQIGIVAEIEKYAEGVG